MDKHERPRPPGVAALPRAQRAGKLYMTVPLTLRYPDTQVNQFAPGAGAMPSENTKPASNTVFVTN